MYGAFGCFYSGTQTAAYGTLDGNKNNWQQCNGEKRETIYKKIGKDKEIK